VRMLKSHRQRRMEGARRARRIVKRAKRKGVTPLEYLAGIIRSHIERDAALQVRSAISVAAEWGW
jgi:hypothetical protein